MTTLSNAAVVGIVVGCVVFTLFIYFIYIKLFQEKPRQNNTWWKFVVPTFGGKSASLSQHKDTGTWTNRDGY